MVCAAGDGACEEEWLWNAEGEVRVAVCDDDVTLFCIGVDGRASSAEVVDEVGWVKCTVEVIINVLAIVDVPLCLCTAARLIRCIAWSGR